MALSVSVLDIIGIGGGNKEVIRTAWSTRYYRGNLPSIHLRMILVNPESHLPSLKTNDYIENMPVTIFIPASFTGTVIDLAYSKEDFGAWNINTYNHTLCYIIAVSSTRGKLIKCTLKKWVIYSARDSVVSFASSSRDRIELNCINKLRRLAGC